MRQIIHVITAALGSGLILLAVFAYNLGIDHNPEWGASRVLLAVGGAGMLLAAALSWCWKALEPARRRIYAVWSRFQTGLAAWWESLVVVRLLRRAGRSAANVPVIRWLAASPERRAALAVWVGAFGLCLVYAWYMTAGTLIQWFPYFHDYFDRLAQAFLNGQVSLLEKPDSRLLALANPYIYDSRGGIPYPWDVSLYQGKYYLYWGPVPGIIAAVIRLVTQMRVEDQALVSGFQVGVGVLLAANLAAMRRRFAPASNPLGLLLLILAGGANLYLLWPNGRPGVYEAALLSGEFFLLAGLLSLFYALQGPTRKVLPALLAGVCLVLAIGSRATLAIAAVWLAGLVVWRIWRGNRLPVGAKFKFLCAFFLPLFLGGAALLWYNYARFGNLIETGLSYQLSIPQYPPERSWLFSPAYLLPNLYGYLLRIPQVGGQFPFVHLPFIQESAWPWYIHLPEHYIYHEPQAGLLVVLPLAGFAALPLIRVIRRWLPGGNKGGSPTAGADSSYEFFWTGLLVGTVILQVGLILAYFFSSLRFQIELVPLVYLLACLGVWRADRLLASHPVWRRIFWLAIMLLALYSLAVGLLGAFSAGDERFETNNPRLFGALRDWFNTFSP